MFIAVVPEIARYMDTAATINLSIVPEATRNDTTKVIINNKVCFGFVTSIKALAFNTSLVGRRIKKGFLHHE